MIPWMLPFFLMHALLFASPAAPPPAETAVYADDLAATFNPGGIKAPDWPEMQILPPDRDPWAPLTRNVFDTRGSVFALSEQIEQMEESGQEPDFLEAYREFLLQRSFPFDTVDWDAYDRAAQQRDQLPAANLVHRRPGEVYTDSLPAPTARWQNVGPVNLDIPQRQWYGVRSLSGRVTCAAFDPNNDGVYYLGSSDGGVWKTTDGGDNWLPLSDKPRSAAPRNDEWPSLQVSSIAVDPDDSDVIYAGTGDFRGFFSLYGFGVMKSEDGGQTWSNRGRADFGNVAISRILINPDDPDILLATTGGRNNFAAVQGRVFRSNDAGNTFRPLVGGANNPPNAVWCDAAVSIPDKTGKRSYYVAGYVFGGAPQVWRSDQNGRPGTWMNVTPATLTGLVIGAGNLRTTSMSLAASPNFPKAVYVMCGTDRSINRSDNRGDNRAGGATSWTNITAGYTALGGIGDTVGGSNVWDQRGYNYYLACSTRIIRGGAEDVLYVGGITISVSYDTGRSWLDIGQTATYTGPLPATVANYNPLTLSNALTHNDQQCAAVNPNNPNELLCGNDGGVYRLTYTPQINTQRTDWTLESLNVTLDVTQFYAAAYHPTQADTILGGAQDNAGPYSNNDLTSWLNVGLGDGGFCAINPTNTNIQYGTTNNLTLLRTGNNWANKVYPNNANSQILGQVFGMGSLFIAPITLDTNNPNILYGGTTQLRFRTDPGGGITGPLGGAGAVLTNGGGSISCIATATDPFSTLAGQASRIFTGSSDGAIFFTNNSGANWTQINAPVVRWVKAIAVDQSSGIGFFRIPRRIFAVFSGTNPNANQTDGVWRCDDVTAAVPVWIKISGLDGPGGAANPGPNSLPNIPINAIALDPDNPSRALFVGTDVGVFYTQQANLPAPGGGGPPDVRWTNATLPLGLPNVMVFGLQAVPGTGYLNAATFGRGVWRIKINEVKLAAITARPNPVKVGQNVRITLRLNMGAPLGGAVVPLTSSTPATAATPDTVTVDANTTTKSFNVRALAVGTTTITATYGGVSMNVVITVIP